MSHLPEDRLVHFSCHGQEITFYLPDPEDHIQKSIAKSQDFYERPMLEDIASRVRPGDLAIDVGANIGSHTVFLAKVLELQVIAFEPYRPAFEILERNVALNQIQDRVTLVNKAVGKAKGHGSIVEPEAKNIGAASVSVDAGGELEIVPLDEILGKKAPKVFKVDVEGMELEVLQGAQGTIEKHHPLIYVETKDEEAYRDVSALLAPLGYRKVGQFNWTPTMLFMPWSTEDEKLEALMARLQSLPDRLAVAERVELVAQIKEERSNFAKAQRTIRELRASMERQDREKKALEGRISELVSQLSDLKSEIYRVQTSKKYRTGYVIEQASHPSMNTLKLPMRLWRIWRSPDPSTRRGGAARGPTKQPRISSVQHQAFYEKFFEMAAASDSEDLVVILSMTRIIGKEERGNRPMRFAQILGRRGVPTLYSYYRARPIDDELDYDGGALFQSPLDVVNARLSDIASRKFDNKNKLLILEVPSKEAVQYLGSFREQGWVVAYDCRDDWEEFAKVGQARWYDEKYERFLANKADFVTTVSVTLKRKMERFMEGGSRAHLVPNGYTRSFLADATREYVLSGRPEADKSSPVIGYFGHLTQAWFDWELLLETAKMRPDWEFEIVGFGEPGEIEFPKNVYLAGPKSHEELNEITRRWNAAIIPFVPGPLAQGVDPIKIYEYLALGLPTVSCLMPQITSYPYTFCYESRQDFASLIAKALETEIDYDRVEEFLSTRTWEHRIDGILELAKKVRSQSQR